MESPAQDPAENEAVGQAQEDPVAVVGDKDTVTTVPSQVAVTDEAALAEAEAVSGEAEPAEKDNSLPPVVEV